MLGWDAVSAQNVKTVLSDEILAQTVRFVSNANDGYINLRLMGRCGNELDAAPAANYENMPSLYAELPSSYDLREARQALLCDICEKSERHK